MDVREGMPLPRLGEEDLFEGDWGEGPAFYQDGDNVRAVPSSLYSVITHHS